MDLLITIIRLPIALLAALFVVLSYAIAFIVETLAAIVCLFAYAVLLSREELRNSWLSHYPNTLYMMEKSLKNMRNWVFDVDNEGSLLGTSVAERILSAVFWGLLLIGFVYLVGRLFRLDFAGTVFIAIVVGTLIFIYIVFSQLEPSNRERPGRKRRSAKR